METKKLLMNRLFLTLIGSFFFMAGNAQNLPIGYLDYVDQYSGGGWAYDQDAGTLPIDVHVYIDGRLYAVVTANESRPDLVTAGITPNPEHGYSFTISGIDLTRAHEIVVYAINYGGGANPPLTNCPAIIGTPPSGDASISNVAGPSTITITTTQRLAGAIGSLTWNGKEFINSYDHGRELQSATSFNGWGECFNPTEAGSSQDGTGNISTSFLQYVNASGNYLETQTLPAFWTQPGYTAPGCGAAINTTQRANHYFRKKVTIGMPGMAHVIKYDTEFDIPESFNSGTFEVVTGYMPTEFSVFWTYNPSTQQLVSLSDGPGEQSLPVIFSTTDNSYAMGIYSPDLPQAQFTGAGYGRFRFGDCTKWNCVFRETSVPQGLYKYRSYVIVGSLENVEVSMNQLYSYFNITADFSADTVCVGTPTSFTNLTIGSNAETIYQWDINNDGSVDETTSANFTYTFPVAGTYPVKLTTINGVAPSHQSSIIKNIVVNPKPATPVVTLYGNTLHSDATSGNQWYNQNGVINGAVNQDYTATEDGYYYDVVTLLGCSSDTSNNIHVIVSGWNTVENSNDIKIYPNAVSNELILEMVGNKEKTDVEIFNPTGQMVYKGSLTDRTIILTNGFAPGVYVIKFKNNKWNESKRFVKE
jgi:PKD repeat protein